MRGPELFSFALMLNMIAMMTARGSVMVKFIQIPSSSRSIFRGRAALPLHWDPASNPGIHLGKAGTCTVKHVSALIL